MKTLTVLGCMGLMTAMLVAGDLNPSLPPAPTMKTLAEVEPRIAINAINTPGDPNNTFVISQPGSYYLTGNITSNFKHAILIDADDVTLDLMGYRLWSSYSKPLGNNEDFDGIHIAADRKNIEIRNGTIASDNTTAHLLTYRGFRYGIHAETGTHRVSLFNIHLANARDDGIFMSGDQHVLKFCTVTENDEIGIRLSGNAQVVQDCTVANNGDSGIELVGDNQQVTDCRIIDNQDCGAKLSGNHQMVQRCIVTNNKYSGIYLTSDGDNSVVTDCIASYNGTSLTNSSSLYGIHTGSGCTVTRNTANYNGQLTVGYAIYGIYVGDNCTIVGNTANYNGDQSTVSHYINGLRLGSACVAQGNAVAFNGKDVIEPTLGIRGINAISGCSIIGNTVYANGSGATDPACGIRVQAYCLIDQNTSYGQDNNLSMTVGGCTVGTNCIP